MDHSTLRQCLALLTEAEALLDSQGDSLQAARLSLVIESFKDVYKVTDADQLTKRRAVH